MFETAELGRSIDKETFKELVPGLRTKLLEVQRALYRNRRFPVVVLVGGVDGAGKGEVVNILNEWMDTRNIHNLHFDQPTEEERHRPRYWRYWMALPPKGTIGMFTGAWYSRVILRRVYDETGEGDLVAAINRINGFEKTLAQDGALIIKVWLHISKKHQRKHFKKLEKSSATAWRVNKLDHKHAKLYDRFRSVCSRVIRETSTGEAPWFVIESGDRRYRDIAVAERVAERIQDHMDRFGERPAPKPEPAIDDPETILDTLDMSQSIDKEAYGERLEMLQGRLNRLGRRAQRGDKGVILVFEGADAAGKGGCIRRVTAALDARQNRVIQVAAPTDEEKAHHYLWRFWRHLPRMGRFTIYDRSWYGRVLVERVEGFALQGEWMRAFKEINDFEEQLVERGIVLCKFWLHITEEEQLRRFQDRERTPWKQYKITEEDYRNREKSNQYEAAANDMIERTSTEYAPWTLVPSQDKRFGRIMVLQTICDRVEAALNANE
jgi:AMP-polyphosphate phosphotransferase